MGKSLFRKMAMACLLAALLLIAACSPSSGAKKELPEVRSGTQGLEFEFLKNAPPKQVFEQSSFPIILRLKNLGAYAIPDQQGILSLAVERDYMGFVAVETGGRISSEAPNEALFSMEGKSLLNTKGDEEVVSFTVTPSKIDPQSETHPSIAIATLCYPYETELLATVCIDPDPNSIRPGKKSCTAQDIPFGNGQGAPVAITKVEVQMLPSEKGLRPQFLIHIENKGKGEVTKLESYRTICRGNSLSATQKDFNLIKMSAWISDVQGKDHNDKNIDFKLKCTLHSELNDIGQTKEDYVRLRAKQDVVRCAYEGTSEQITNPGDSFTTPLRILLSYGYTQSITADYVIKKISMN